jgi:sugar lactone lactonase YvrE
MFLVAAFLGLLGSAALTFTVLAAQAGYYGPHVARALVIGVSSLLLSGLFVWIVGASGLYPPATSTCDDGSSSTRLRRLPAMMPVASGLSYPAGVAVDAHGAVYIADYDHNRVVKETPAGGAYSETTVASNVIYPEGVAVDDRGAVYIASGAGAVVLKETPVGAAYTQTTITSNGLSAPSDVAVNARGAVYIADPGTHRVLKETPVGRTYAQTLVADAARGLIGPWAVAVDAHGAVYIADQGAGRVLKETPAGATYSQAIVAAHFGGPVHLQGVAVDAHGTVYVATYDNVCAGEMQGGGCGRAYDNRVFKETPVHGTYTQSILVNCTGGLNVPTAVAVDSHGNLYIADVTGVHELPIPSGT